MEAERLLTRQQSRKEKNKDKERGPVKAVQMQRASKGQSKETTKPDTHRDQGTGTYRDRRESHRVKGAEGHTEKENLREVCSLFARARERPCVALPLAGQPAQCCP